MKLIENTKNIFPNVALLMFSIKLEKLLKDCDTVLDVGCGENSPLRLIETKNSVGVDGFEQAINRSKKRKIHPKYRLMDIRELTSVFKENSFDAVIALDVVEHLEKREGSKLIKEMEKIAKKKVVILTPNGFIQQKDSANNLQEHLSGWRIKDFHKRKYKVFGEYGLKNLRGERASLVKPKYFWGMISYISQLIVRSYPKYSFSLLCVKEL